MATFTASIETAARELVNMYESDPTFSVTYSEGMTEETIDLILDRAETIFSDERNLCMNATETGAGSFRIDLDDFADDGDDDGYDWDAYNGDSESESMDHNDY